jgi:putrescine transport system ATP-binding protein
MNGAPDGDNFDAVTLTGHASSSAGLMLERLTVERGGCRIVNQASCRIPTGGALVIVGESGCGKTTLLKAVAGLIPVTAGRVMLDGQDLAPLSLAERRVLYLDQEPLLFEHLTVVENLAFPLLMRGESRSVAMSAAREMLDAVGIAAHASKRPGQLSGGQKQRTAFARAVLARPRVLLLDEPFSALDAATRSAMQQLFLKLASAHQLTSLLVTHDIREALAAGSAFCRMDAGALLQYADRQAFIADEVNGVREELEFWERQRPNCP